MKQFLRSLWQILAMIVAFFIYQYLQEFYFYPQDIQHALHVNSFFEVIITVVLTLAILTLLIRFYQKQLTQKNDWNFGQNKWNYHYLGVVFLGVILMFSLGTLIELVIISSTKQVTSANQEALDKVALQSGNLFKLMVAIIAPICEEIIFRGLFFNTFFTKDNQMNKWLGILTSGFLFAYMHDPALTQFIFVYWPLGCILAWVYLKTRDLRYNILTHIIYNSLSFII